ncbi:pyrroloquinoline quinone precursor peptide PqqA [Azospirillum sp. A39]|uniref:pyrroloquinoline quinone precursor peptide PqqA n=1 Tax=Azospirillum sp. A39 TaxID=3462279 RepID=UPI004046428C
MAPFRWLRLTTGDRAQTTRPFPDPPQGGRAHQEGPATMKTWRKPQIVEIAVGNEINAYACADL